MSGSLADGNGAAGIDVEDPGTSVTVSGSVLSNNALAGLRTSFNPAAARIGGSTVIENGVGLQRVSGTLLTFGDNLVHGNTTDTGGTITPVGKT